MIFTTSLCLLALTHLTQASLSPTFPVSGSTCAVSTDCQIKWQDTPASPSTASMGETAIDLVTGDPNNLQIAQRLGGVSNPGTALAMTFKPDPSLSSTARYAIRFVAKSNPTAPIFSTFFTITGGNGTGKTVAASTIDIKSSPLTPPANSSIIANTSNSTSSSTHSNSSSTASTAAEKSGASPRLTHTISSGLVVMGVIFSLLL